MWRHGRFDPVDVVIGRSLDLARSIQCRPKFKNVLIFHQGFAKPIKHFVLIKPLTDFALNRKRDADLTR